MTFPSRRPEARRAEYLRNKGARQATYLATKGTAHYAKKVLAQSMGVPIGSVPAELAEAKLLQLQMMRLVKTRQDAELSPLICEQYMQGRTSYDLAGEYGFDRGRISAILRNGGVTMKRRPQCKKGHDMTDTNTAWTPQGHRRCRKCQADKSRRWAEKSELYKLAISSPRLMIRCSATGELIPTGWRARETYTRTPTGEARCKHCKTTHHWSFVDVIVEF